MKESISVIGGGSFGTAIANLLSQNKHSVHLWLRDAALAQHINEKKENIEYLPGIRLHSGIKATTDLNKVVQSSHLIFLVIPTKYFRYLIKQITPFIQEQHILVSCAKGFEAEQFCLMSQVLQQELPQTRFAVLSGPNLAKEIANKTITGSVVASPSMEVCRKIQQTMSCQYFRVYANQDIYGVELGGALKNIYAIAAGMADALGAGQNAKSMLITRSLAEMSRFAVQLGANPLTFLGLAGVGDLVATCTSPLSRNFRIGYAIAQGKTLEQAIMELGQQVAEGVETLKIVYSKAKEINIYMPIVTGLYRVLYQGEGINKVVKELMLGEQNVDVEFSLS